METYNNIPVFQIDFTDESFWNAISLVDVPAIERNFIKLSKDAELKLAINEEKREVSGPVILPDQLIYRRDANGEYYIKFSAETIKKMAQEFFKQDAQNTGNIQHQFGVDGITFFESYLINRDRGLFPVEFEDLPDGTWMVTAKIDNDNVWNLVKSGEIRGFSIDCQAAFRNDREIDKLQDFFDYLNNNK